MNRKLTRKYRARKAVDFINQPNKKRFAAKMLVILAAILITIAFFFLSGYCYAF